MKLSRVKRLLKIRDFELKEAQQQYAESLNYLSSLDRDIDKMQSYKTELVNRLVKLQNQSEAVRAEQIKMVYQSITFIETTLFSLNRRRQDVISYLDKLRQIMLERKKDRDMVEKIKAKMEYGLFKEQLDKERKDADEKAIQQFFHLQQ